MKKGKNERNEKERKEMLNYELSRMSYDTIRCGDQLSSTIDPNVSKKIRKTISKLSKNGGDML